MREVVYANVAHRKTMMRCWYFLYVLGALTIYAMALPITDSFTAAMVGLVSFWLIAVTFIYYPFILECARRIEDRALRTLFVTLSLACFWCSSAGLTILCFSLVPALMQFVGAINGGSEIGLFVMGTPFLLHGTAILRAEDASYGTVLRCIGTADLPQSFTKITDVLQFCETRELRTEADMISKLMMRLAEFGYFSTAA